MSTLILAFGVIAIFAFAYRYYGGRLARLFDVNPANRTPAHTRYDGVDYVPARNWLVLFGHHFSSIAGAGPILGPVIAGAVWGWGPAVLWILLGSIFIGGVHDFSSLMVSLRSEGRSVAETAEQVLGVRIRMVFALFLWLCLILVIAVFAASAAKTLQTTPEIVIPTFGIVFLAVFVGLLLYRWRMNALFATGIGLVLFFILILLGLRFPIRWSYHGWLVALLLIYAATASVLPVNIILQPRDYLSFFVLLFGMLIGYIGLVLTHPVVRTPAFVSFSGGEGYLLPMLCVTVACGAISGFHALVASGTTSKQLNREEDARRIGYGAMLVEGVLAVLAVVCVTGGLRWYGGPAGMVYPELVKSGNWIRAFGQGYGEITRPLLGNLGMFLGITMLKTFIVTTLDTATRITRYIGTELFGERLGIRPMRNMYFNTLVVIGLATWLAFGAWQSIWPVFGAANQLVAALVFLVITTWLFVRGKPTRYTLIPGVFMLLVTTSALVLLTVKFIAGHRFTLAVIALVLLLLAGVMVAETLRRLRRLNPDFQKGDPKPVSG